MLPLLSCLLYLDLRYSLPLSCFSQPHLSNVYRRPLADFLHVCPSATPAEIFHAPLTPEPSAPGPNSYQLRNGGASSSGGSSYGGSPSRTPGTAGGSAAGSAAGGSSGDSGSQRKRFGNGLGRKIRTALADLLSSR